MRWGFVCMILLCLSTWRAGRSSRFFGRALDNVKCIFVLKIPDQMSAHTNRQKKNYMEPSARVHCPLLVATKALFFPMMLSMLRRRIDVEMVLRFFI